MELREAAQLPHEAGAAASGVEDQHERPAGDEIGERCCRSALLVWQREIRSAVTDLRTVALRGRSCPGVLPHAVPPNDLFGLV